jgi:hypothetical protein
MASTDAFHDDFLDAEPMILDVPADLDDGRETDVYPPLLRFAVIAGLSSTLWALLIAGFWTLLRVIG